MWKQTQPIPPESMGWCLLHALPHNDERFLQQRIVDLVSAPAICTKEGADIVVEALGTLIRNPTFVRLVEWDLSWSSIKQGTKSFDAFVTKVRNLAKESKEEFGLDLPKGIIAAKLLGGCSQISAENIGVITQGLTITGKEGQGNGEDVSRAVEEAIRKHISTVRVFTAPNKTNHVGYAGRLDVMGHPLSPEPGDLRHRIGNDNNEEVEVYAGTAKQNKPPPKKQRTAAYYEERRERLRKEGRCFECESSEHRSFDCPKKAERLKRVREDCEKRGEIFRGDKQQKLNKVNYTKRVNDDLQINLDDSEFLFSDDEEEDGNNSRGWKTYFSKEVGDQEEEDQIQVRSQLLPALVASDDEDDQEEEATPRQEGRGEERGPHQDDQGQGDGPEETKGKEDLDHEDIAKDMANDDARHINVQDTLLNFDIGVEDDNIGEAKQAENEEVISDQEEGDKEAEVIEDIGEEPLNLWKSYMAKHGTVDITRPNQVHFTSSRSDHALIDTGCQKSCAGQAWFDAYKANLSQSEKAMILEQVGSSSYKFGGAGIYKSQKLVIAPVYVGGARKVIKFDVVSTDIPLLLSLKMMQKLRMNILCREDEDNLAKVGDTTFKLHYSDGHLYIPLGKAASKASILYKEEPGNNNVVFLATGNIFTQGKEVEQIKKIHIGAGHAPLHKMRTLLKEAGQWTDKIRELVSGVLQECNVRRCRESGELQKKDPHASIKIARELGDIVNVDLKIRRGGRDILYAVDSSTSFTVAGFIDNKTSEEVATCMFRIWYGNNLPRIKIVRHDNGSEFVGDAFVTMNRLFNTHNTRSVPYHPAGNGTVERVHSIIDGIMERLMEGNSSLSEDMALMWATSSYNAATMTTGFSPCQLVYGCHNTDIGVMDLDVMDFEESPIDKSYRYMEDFRIRQQARDSHNMVKNSNKLKQILLRKSNPTPEVKPVGTHVWVKRHGQFIGIGQVCHSLGSEAGVKMSKGWLTCKHSDLMRLNSRELVKYNLGGENMEEIRDEAEEAEGTSEPIFTEIEHFQTQPTAPEYVHPNTFDNAPSDTESDSDSVSSRGSSANTSNPPPPREMLDNLVDLLNNHEILSTDRGQGTSGNTSAVTSDNDPTDTSDQSSETGSDNDQAGQANPPLARAASLPQIPDQAQSDPARASSNSDISRTGRNKKPRTPRKRAPLPPTTRSPRSPPSLASQPATKKSVIDNRTDRYGQHASTIKTINVINNPRAKGDIIEIYNKGTNRFEAHRVIHGSRKPSSRSVYKLRTESGLTTWQDLHQIAWREGGPMEQIEDTDSDMDIQHVAITKSGETHRVYHTTIPPWQHDQEIVIKAKNKEMSSHHKFGTFKEVKLDSLSKEEKDLILPSTWSICFKGNPADKVVKARLCARGDLEKGVENIRTDSPTVNSESLRLLLTHAASTGFKIRSLDFSSAFVQGKDIERTVYLRPPPDIRKEKPGIVWKVVKRLYGFKDASRGWMQALDEDLKKLGMTRSHFDKGLYMYYENNVLVGLIAVHVDDILISGPLTMYNKIVGPLKNKYVIGSEDQGYFTFTGWNLLQTKDGITLSQEDYMEKTDLQQFDHFRGYMLSDKEQLDDNDQSLFRSLNGILGWISGTSRPQLAFHYSTTSSKLNRATKGDAKHLFRLIEKTKVDRSMIRFSNLGDPSTWKYEVFIDASPGKSRVYDSYIGEVCFLTSKHNVRNITSWKSQKLETPTATPLEAEAEALLNANAKVRNFRFLFKEVFNLDISADIITDSKSLATNTNSDNSATKNRKIAVAVVTARKLMEEAGGAIRLLWTEGNKNPSDLLTKGTADPRILLELIQTGKSSSMASNLAIK